MAPRKTTKSRNTKPILVRVGKHFINPEDVTRISRVTVRGNPDFDDEESLSSKVLYVVEFKSNPNPNYTCWVEKKDIGILLEQFNIITEDK